MLTLFNLIHLFTYYLQIPGYFQWIFLCKKKHLGTYHNPLTNGITLKRVCKSSTDGAREPITVTVGEEVKSHLPATSFGLEKNSAAMEWVKHTWYGLVALVAVACENYMKLVLEHKQ